MPSESATGFIGSMVSIDCGKLGTYQGHVQRVDADMNTLTITHAFHNGLRCDQSEVNLSSTTILDIQIIHSSTVAKEIIERKTTPSKMTKEIDEVTKPRCSSPVKIIKAASKARSAGFTPSSSANSNSNTEKGQGKSSHGCRRKLSPPDSPSAHLLKGNNSVGPRPRISKSANRDGYDSNDQGVGQGNGQGVHGAKQRGHQGQDSQYRKHSASKKMERGGKKGANSWNSDCFSAPAESFLQDFDFESNLALFNKKAVFQEIENDFPDLSLESDPREQKYRHDENILQPGESTNAGPATIQQIQVPGAESQLYYTDNGLVVPSISFELREQVCDTAAHHGLTRSRQIEAFGRAATEMVIHLIGGSHRIHPKNDHQMPVVVVLCGPHDQGTLGVCCARILASHGVQVTVMLPSSSHVPQSLTDELNLYKLSRCPLVDTTKGLPGTIDLIVNALDDPVQPALSIQSWYQEVVSWISNSDIRAQILALDPPSQGPGISAKWSLCKVLPLCHVSPSCGNLYLCDLSIPATIYSHVGIKYKSPFGSKFVIPLHLQA
ncbi:enhancer of mRNA-decapping protein 3 [Aplysia californica]|uniref:Enhancer of mRNA-decapping protein 3 n=1 Tax=Aplysia californica TaxID=6500 RepID=A0ABM0JHU4_APLCA|nr:enhancer of mRNA-decapping protein 3 [Aplysia californica]